MWERPVRRWNFAGDAAHSALKAILVGPTLVRPRVLQYALASAYDLSQEEVDTKILSMLEFLKGGREESVATWIGSGFTHSTASSMASSYAIAAVAAAK